MSLAVCSLLLLAQLQLLDFTALLSLGCFGKLSWAWLMRKLDYCIYCSVKEAFSVSGSFIMKESVPTGKEVKCFILLHVWNWSLLCSPQAYPLLLALCLHAAFSCGIILFYLFIYLMTWWCNSNVLDRCSWCWQGKLELIDWWWLIVFRVICGDGHYLSPGSGVEVNLVTWPVILEIPSACQSHVILQVFGQSPVPCEIHLSPDLVVLLAGYQTSLNQWKNWKKSILWGITITSRTIQIFFYTSSFFFFFSSVNFHSVWAHPHCIYTSLQK